MKFFITKKKLIKTLAEELAYLQINADWWYYCFCDDVDKVLDEVTGTTPRDMSSRNLDLVTEVRAIASRLGILTDVYKEAYKIYDFRNSGKEGFVANVDLIKELKSEFVDPMKKKRPVF